MRQFGDRTLATGFKMLSRELWEARMYLTRRAEWVGDPVPVAAGCASMLCDPQLRMEVPGKNFEVATLWQCFDDLLTTIDERTRTGEPPDADDQFRPQWQQGRSIIDLVHGNDRLPEQFPDRFQAFEIRASEWPSQERMAARAYAWTLLRDEGSRVEGRPPPISRANLRPLVRRVFTDALPEHQEPLLVKIETIITDRIPRVPASAALQPGLLQRTRNARYRRLCADYQRGLDGVVPLANAFHDAVFDPEFSRHRLASVVRLRAVALREHLEVLVKARPDLTL